MKLEEEIRQSKFEDEFHKLGVNIIYTSNWLLSHHAKQLKKFGLSPEQYNLLRILRGQYPKAATVNLLIERMLNKMSNASRLVEKLKKKGWVDRTTSSVDRRSCDVLITKSGLHILELLDKEQSKLRLLMQTLSLSEAEKINQLLDKMRA